jgi:tetratricopeptide (TPR) repeat protein
MKNIFYLLTVLLLSSACYSQKADKYYKSGCDKLGQQNYRGAIADFNKAIEVDPEYALAYYNRGNANFLLGDFKPAVSDYDKTIALDPKNEDAYFKRGNVKHALTDYSGAISDYNKADELTPLGDEHIYVNRGNSKYYLQDYKGAISDFTKAIEFNPECTNAYYYRGMTEIAIGQKDNGCTDLKKALELGSSLAYGAVLRHCQ